MKIKFCVAKGEVNTTKEFIKKDGKNNEVSDIVKAGTGDIIYFYHIDSCMGAAFFPEKNNDPIVGVHLSLAAPKSEWKLDDSGACAKYYLEQLAPLKIKFSHAVYFGTAGEWGFGAAVLTESLKISNALFLEMKNAADAWAIPGEISSVAWMNWQKKAIQYKLPEANKFIEKKEITGTNGIKGIEGPPAFSGVYESYLKQKKKELKKKNTLGS